MEENRFFIFSCPSCGHFQTKEIRNMATASFKCFKCGKSRKIRSKGQFNLKFYGKFSCNNAVDKILELKNGKN